MAGVQHQEFGLVPKLVLVIGAVLIVWGLIRFDLTAQTVQRIWNDLTNRPDGPMSFRFILQPAMAMLAALYDGVRDARAGRSPYLWTILHKPEKRMARLGEGLIATARIMLIGVVIDAIYQWRVLGTFYPTEALLIALALAFIPYLLLRGPVTRIAYWWKGRQPDSRHAGGRR